MLLPREKPFLTGLNSYYLDIEKFIQHLQGEIGSGCLHGKGAEQELMIYFDESDIVRSVTQTKGQPALVSERLAHVLPVLASRNFQVTIYYLDPDSIFFWGQLPAFRRAKNSLSSVKVSLPDLSFRLHKKSFSGFIEIDLKGRPECAILFFHEGHRQGGSYYWGRGGMSPSDYDYNTLLSMMQKSEGIYKLGYFMSAPAAAEQPAPAASAEAQPADAPPENAAEQQTASKVNWAINEFIKIFLAVAAAKAPDPLIELRLKFIDFITIYPVLDPYKQSCRIEPDGKVVFSDSRAVLEGAEGIVDCAWMVIEDNKLHKKFSEAVETMASRNILIEQGIELDQ